jgi:hypothetical protein
MTIVNRKILWLRISYWAGAIVDGLAALQMLFPKLYTLTSDTGFAPNAEFGYAMRSGAPLMVGWTVLLIWADRRPVERKGVLLITVIPVVIGVALNQITAIPIGVSSVGAMIPIWTLQAVLIALFTFSYLNARDVSPGNDN